MTAANIPFWLTGQHVGGSLLGSAGLGCTHWAQLGSQCLLVKVPGWQRNIPWEVL